MSEHGPDQARARRPAGTWLATIRSETALLTNLDKFALGVVGVVMLLAVLGPLIAPQPTEEANVAQRLLAPGSAHWLGTDENGIDIFSRILAAPRVDVLVAVAATAISVAIGVPLGVIAGYLEAAPRRSSRAAAAVFLRVLDVIQAFPVFILALLLVAVRGTSVLNIVIAIAFVNTPVFIRLVRTEILSERERPYAEAARAVGNGEWGVAFRHLLPNAITPVVVQVSVTVGFAILLTAGLSFVGAGVRAPTPELGTMVAGGSKFLITGQWWPSVFPGLALGLMIFAFAVVGEAVGKMLVPGAVRRSRVPVTPTAGVMPLSRDEVRL